MKKLFLLFAVVLVMAGCKKEKEWCSPLMKGEWTLVSYTTVEGTFYKCPAPRVVHVFMDDKIAVYREDKMDKPYGHYDMTYLPNNRINFKNDAHNEHYWDAISIERKKAVFVTNWDLKFILERL